MLNINNKCLGKRQAALGAADHTVYQSLKKHAHHGSASTMVELKPAIGVRPLGVYILKGEDATVHRTDWRNFNFCWQAKIVEEEPEDPEMIFYYPLKL